MAPICPLLQIQRSTYFFWLWCRLRLKLFSYFCRKLVMMQCIVDGLWLWCPKRQTATYIWRMAIRDDERSKQSVKKVVLRAVEWLQTVMTESQSLNRWGTFSRAKIISFLPPHYICNSQCVALQELVHSLFAALFLLFRLPSAALRHWRAINDVLGIYGQRSPNWRTIELVEHHWSRNYSL